MLSNTFRIRAGGRCFTGQYISGTLAVVLAQCFYRVHSATAVRVST